MAKRSYTTWLHLAANINSLKKSICPICNMISLEHIYVGDSKTRVGFLRVWCKNCLKGIHISRVLVPEDENLIDFNENPHLPQFEEVTP